MHLFSPLSWPRSPPWRPDGADVSQDRRPDRGGRACFPNPTPKFEESALHTFSVWEDRILGPLREGIPPGHFAFPASQIKFMTALHTKCVIPIFLDVKRKRKGTDNTSISSAP